mgnify:CR=1 FL=1
MNQSLLGACLYLSLILFAIGAVGVLSKRNAISLFMCIELMLNAANLAILTFALRGGWMTDGSLLVLFIITVAAAEAGVGLAVFIKIFNEHKHVDVDRMEELKG